MIELQFYYQCRLADVAARNHHEVGIAFASGILPVNDILVPCPNICHRKYTGQGIFVIIGEDAGVLVMSLVDAFCHGLLVA